MQPIGPLMIEHRLIERCVGQMAALAEAIDQDGTVDLDATGLCVDFVRTYADRCHHGKEEDILFRALAQKPIDPPLERMMDGLILDHVHGRNLTGRLVDAMQRFAAGRADARHEIQEGLTGLVALYPGHIEKEDKHFFKPAMAHFSPEEQETMLAAFREFDRSLIHERYRLLVERLEAMER